ncbi:hypothetical protein HMPREF9374_1866 [Desmospora sp. 8437]|nr:hypothetical protein HMPREF9374_1866 [Desmospora sp. 8437]
MINRFIQHLAVRPTKHLSLIYRFTLEGNGKTPRTGTIPSRPCMNKRQIFGSGLKSGG